MSLSFHPSNRRCLSAARPVPRIVFASALLLLVALSCRGSDTIVPSQVELRSIAIDSGSRVLERGTRDTLTASAEDRGGQAVTVPVVWRSSNENIAVFQRGGVLVALDTGTTIVTASSLGVTSPPVAVTVVWLGPAAIDSAPWTRPSAVNPGAVLTDSLRVIVTNIKGQPVANAKVAFKVTSGGGSMSPAVVTTGNNGTASSQWTLGQGTGLNSVTAAVVEEDGATPNPLVADNAVTFTTTSYVALTIEGGDAQTGQILSDLPASPSVKLVDSLGAPRPGVPVQFTAFENGGVTTAIVSTDAAGIATPGTWTLGDIPGAQRLDAKVSDARVSFGATATGTPIRYTPARVIAGEYSTCALQGDNTVECWGVSPQNGSGSPDNVSTPTAVSGGLVAATVAGGSSHFCAVTSVSEGWCWGVSALADTTGQNTDPNAPLMVQSTISWSQIAAGQKHNCATNVNQIAYCWGANTNGQLGDNTTTTRFVPAAVFGGFKFSGVSAGVDHSCGLDLSGKALCWGANLFGQVGDGTNVTPRKTPTTVAGGLTFQSIGAGEVFTCGLSTTGEAYCWGGLSGSAQSTPQTYAGSPTFTSMSVGGGHVCALGGDGTAYCWGSNAWGQLGDSTVVSRTSPTKVAGGLHFLEISAGYQHTCARTTEGAVACWGRNTAGELGESTSSQRLTPHYIVLGVLP